MSHFFSTILAFMESVERLTRHLIWTSICGALSFLHVELFAVTFTHSQTSSGTGPHFCATCDMHLDLRTCANTLGSIGGNTPPPIFRTLGHATHRSAVLDLVSLKKHVSRFKVGERKKISPFEDGDYLYIFTTGGEALMGKRTFDLPKSAFKALVPRTGLLPSAFFSLSERFIEISGTDIFGRAGIAKVPKVPAYLDILKDSRTPFLLSHDGLALLASDGVPKDGLIIAPGEFRIRAGEVVMISNEAGSYRGAKAHLDFAVREFKALGLRMTAETKYRDFATANINQILRTHGISELYGFQSLQAQQDPEFRDLLSDMRATYRAYKDSGKSITKILNEMLRESMLTGNDNEIELGTIAQLVFEVELKKSIDQADESILDFIVVSQGKAKVRQAIDFVNRVVLETTPELIAH